MLLSNVFLENQKNEAKKHEKIKKLILLGKIDKIKSTLGLTDNEPKYKINYFKANQEYIGLLVLISILCLGSYLYSIDLVKNFDFGIKVIFSGLFVNLLSSMIVIFVYDITKSRREEGNRRKRLSLQFYKLHNILHIHFSRLINCKWLKTCEPNNNLLQNYSNIFNLNKNESGNNKSFETLEIIIFQMVNDLKNVLNLFYDHQFIMQDEAAEIVYEITEKDKLSIKEYTAIVNQFFEENKELLSFEEFLNYKRLILNPLLREFTDIYSNYLFSIANLRRFVISFKDVDLEFDSHLTYGWLSNFFDLNQKLTRESTMQFRIDEIKKKQDLIDLFPNYKI